MPARDLANLEIHLDDTLRRAAANERVAQRALYDRYAAVVVRVCQRFARTPDEARDFAQEAWLRAFARLDSYTGAGSFEGWLRHLTANCCITQLRRAGLRLTVLPEVLPEGVDFEPNALDQLATEDILATIAQLPDGYRLVFNLVALEGFSHAEAARALGITESASRSQLTRARSTLQRRLGQFLSLCFL